MESNPPVFLAYPLQRQPIPSSDQVNNMDRPENTENAIDHENNQDAKDLESVEDENKNGPENSELDSDSSEEAQNSQNGLNSTNESEDTEEEDSNEDRDNNEGQLNENEKDDLTELDPLLNPPPEHHLYDEVEPESTHFILPPPMKQDSQGAPTNYDPEGISGPTPPQPLPNGNVDNEAAGTKYIHIIRPKNRPPRNNGPIRYVFGNGITAQTSSDDDYSQKGTTVHIPFLFPVNNIIVPSAAANQLASAIESQAQTQIQTTTVGDFAEPQTTKPTTTTRLPITRKPSLTRPSSIPTRPRSFGRPIARPSNLAGVRQFAPPGFAPGYPRPNPYAAPLQSQQAFTQTYARPNPVVPSIPQYAPIPQYPTTQQAIDPPTNIQYTSPAPVYEQGPSAPDDYQPSNAYGPGLGYTNNIQPSIQQFNTQTAIPSNYLPGPPMSFPPVPTGPNYSSAPSYAPAPVNPNPNQYAPPPSTYQTIRNPPPPTPEYIAQTPPQPQNAYQLPPSSYHPIPQTGYAGPAPPAAQTTAYAGPYPATAPQTYVVTPQGNENPYDPAAPAYNIQESPYPLNPAYTAAGPPQIPPQIPPQGPGGLPAYPNNQIPGYLLPSASTPTAAKMLPLKGKVGSNANSPKTIKYVTKPDYAKISQQKKKVGKPAGNR